MMTELERQREAVRAARARMGAPIPPSRPATVPRTRVMDTARTDVPDARSTRPVPPPVPRATTTLLPWERILEDTAIKHQVSSKIILSRGRSPNNIKWVRWELWHRISRELRWSYSKIGEKMGRDFSTVRHGVLRYEDHIKNGSRNFQEFQENVRQVR